MTKQVNDYSGWWVFALRAVPYGMHVYGARPVDGVETAVAAVMMLKDKHADAMLYEKRGGRWMNPMQISPVGEIVSKPRGWPMSDTDMEILDQWWSEHADSQVET